MRTLETLGFEDESEFAEVENGDDSYFARFVRADEDIEDAVVAEIPPQSEEFQAARENDGEEKLLSFQDMLNERPYPMPAKGDTGAGDREAYEFSEMFKSYEAREAPHHLAALSNAFAFAALDDALCGQLEKQFGVTAPEKNRRSCGRLRRSGAHVHASKH